MPSKAPYSDSDIIKVLKKHQIFHPNKKLKKKKFKEPDGTSVWKLAQEDLPSMKLQNIYLFVLQNRRQVHLKLKAYHFPNVVKLGEVKSDDNESHHSSESESHHSSESENDNLTINEPKEDQITGKPDEYVQLHLLKCNVLFQNIIHRIGINPFCITYWSAEQTNIFKDMLKIDGHSICVIVLKDFLPSIQLRKYTSNNNCLVSIACNLLDTPTFTANLITDTLDKEIVQHFIMDFFKKMPSWPSEITVVYHRSTIEEVCFALNTCSLSEHNAQCLSYLEGKRKTLPKVLISIDLMTLLLSASKSPHFKLKSADIQKSLIKFIIYLKYVSNLEDFKTTVMQILFIIFSPFENQDTLDTATIIEHKVDSPVISALYEDFRKFTADNVLSNFAAISDIESDKSSRDLLKYIDDLSPNIDEKSCKNGTPNSYYCKLWYTTTLRFVLAEFPSWTCIISKSRDMNLIKNVLRNHVDFIGSNNSLKISVFVETHILQCDEQVQRRRAFLNQKRVKKLKKETKDKTEKCTSNVLHLDYQENWGGLNACYKKKDLIIENKCDETEVEYDISVPPFEDIPKLSEIRNNVCAEKSIDEKPHVKIDEVAVIDSARKESDNCDSIFNTKYELEEPISEKHENSAAPADVNILFSSSTLPNEEFHSSDVLAGSIFVENTNNVSSFISQSLDHTIGVPYKNSTFSSDKNIDNPSSEVLLERDSSTLSLLNKNIDINNRNEGYMIDEKEVYVENTFAHLLSVKRPLEVDSSKVNIPIKKKRKAVAGNKKKKYLTRCPDMELQHQQVTTSKSIVKDHFIRNGNTLEPRPWGKEKYTLDNTS